MVTGIKNEDVFGRKQFRAMVDDVEDFFAGAMFAAHNVDFDYGFLSEEFKRSGSKLMMDRFCTARLSKKFYPEHRSHSLDNVILRHGYEVANRHRALDDAQVIAQFFIDHLSDNEVVTWRHVNSILKRHATVQGSKPRIVPLM